MLAAMLLFGSEILLWLNPPGRTAGEWLMLGAGYVALAALALDLAARYRLRDLYDAMLLAAIYGLLNGLLLNPATALELIPDTVINRVLGGHTLLGWEMFGLFLALTGGHIRRYQRLLPFASLWIGFYWGIWVRWLPAFTQLVKTDIALTTMLTYGAAGLVVIVVLFVLASKRTGDVTPLDLRLSVLEWGAALVVLIVLFLVHVGRDAIDSDGLGLTAMLVAVCIVVLWFRRAERGKTLLDDHLPMTPLSWKWIALALVIFAASSILAYNLPLVHLFDLDQFRLMALGYGAVGVGWLPFIASVLGYRTLDRHSRTGKI
jgi:hypothetical protein